MKRQESQPQPQAGADPPAGTPVIADVFAEGDSKAVDFSLEWRFQGESNPRKGAIGVPGRKPTQPGTRIHFNLHDGTDRQLRFDTANPIWVSRTNCPTGDSSDPEIPENQIQALPLLLKLFDRNQDKCELHYTLVFKDRDGTREVFDPMIRNGGLI